MIDVKTIALASELLLATGQVLTLPAVGRHAWFSRDDLIEAQVIDQNIVIKAKKEGSLYAANLINAKSGQPTKIMIFSPPELRRIRGCAQNKISLERYPPVLHLSYDAAENFLKQCPLNRLQITDGPLQSEWERRLNEREDLLRRKGFHFEVLLQDDKRILRTSKGLEPNLRAELGGFVAFYSIEPIEEVSRPGRTLLFDLSLLELSKNSLKSLGLKLPTEIDALFKGGRVYLQPGAGQKMGLSMGSFEGLGKILAQPRLRVRPGDLARFQSGGEIPIKQNNAHGSSLSWKPYGLQLTLEPDGRTATGAQEISLKAQIELSEPDPATAIDGTPGLITRKLESHFDLRSDEATVLGTLSFTRNGQQKNGFSAFKWFPLLNELLSHTGSQDQSSELWIVIRPSWEEIPLAQFARAERSFKK